jgi:hypothetical protein
MEITFGNFGKVEVSWKIAIISTAVGIALYSCEWIELFAPSFSGFCKQAPPYDLLIAWGRIIIPYLLAGVIGYFGFKEPLFYWLLFTMPSMIVRDKEIIESSNIYPIAIGLDFIFLVMLPGIVLGIVALFRRKNSKK